MQLLFRLTPEDVDNCIKRYLNDYESETIRYRALTVNWTADGCAEVSVEEKK